MTHLLRDGTTASGMPADSADWTVMPLINLNLHDGLAPGGTLARDARQSGTSG